VGFATASSLIADEGDRVAKSGLQDRTTKEAALPADLFEDSGTFSGGDELPMSDGFDDELDGGSNGEFNGGEFNGDEFNGDEFNGDQATAVSFLDIQALDPSAGLDDLSKRLADEHSREDVQTSPGLAPVNRSKSREEASEAEQPVASRAMESAEVPTFDDPSEIDLLDRIASQVVDVGALPPEAAPAISGVVPATTLEREPELPSSRVASLDDRARSKRGSVLLWSVAAVIVFCLLAVGFFYLG
jgi:hypothetical protein